MHDRDTTIGRPAVTLAHLAAHIRALQYRLLTAEPIVGFAMMLVETLLEASLAAFPLLAPGSVATGTVLAETGRLSYLGFHSKVLHELASRVTGDQPDIAFARGISSFLCATPKSRKGASLD